MPAAIAELETVDRKGIEQLIGDDEMMCPRKNVDAVDAVDAVDSAEPLSLAGGGLLIRFDQGVVRRLSQLRRRGMDVPQHRLCECAGSRANLGDTKRFGAITETPQLERLVSDGGAEDRMDFRAGEEIAIPSNRRLPASVVSVLGVVEALFHPICEGHWTIALDARRKNSG